MIDWKEACRLLRRRYRQRSEWWRDRGEGWQSAGLYWMRRADAAEKRVRELEAVLRAIQAPDPVSVVIQEENRRINESLPEPTYGSPESGRRR